MAKGFSVLTWNVQGVKNYTQTDFEDVAPLIDKTSADILCLQEMPHAKSKINMLKNIYSYDICIPKVNSNYVHADLQSKKHNYNIILSKFPIIRTGEIEFPKMKKIILENILWADINIRGSIVRVYNCHLAIIGVGIAERVRQLRQVLNHAKKCKTPTIMCGDMNTATPETGMRRKVIKWLHDVPDDSMVIDGKIYDKDERFLFSSLAKHHGFRDALRINVSTWALPHTSFQMFNLKLDWFLIREIHSLKVRYGKYVSDHKPILVTCVL